ncbi:hypothetical protein [Geopsychrobacter electrodiphilus]|uniref:hypothetical protein n=1 Tax=Geopsychrobacter electrodiphilus TaxID=225196 RepID=UPI00036E6E48|nr:hypothetical protein [Geopsychrobacter electrodiphilus]
MNETVSVTYVSVDAMKNAENELIAAQIPEENFFVDKDKLEIKVITPKATKSTIEELLNRHNHK